MTAKTVMSQEEVTNARNAGEIVSVETGRELLQIRIMNGSGTGPEAGLGRIPKLSGTNTAELEPKMSTFTATMGREAPRRDTPSQPAMHADAPDTLLTIAS